MKHLTCLGSRDYCLNCNIKLPDIVLFLHDWKFLLKLDYLVFSFGSNTFMELENLDRVAFILLSPP